MKTIEIDECLISSLRAKKHWNLPNGERISARVYEVYHGLTEQLRVGLCDEHGRVHHYDLQELVEVAQ